VLFCGREIVWSVNALFGGTPSVLLGPKEGMEFSIFGILTSLFVQVVLETIEPTSSPSVHVALITNFSPTDR